MEIEGRSSVLMNSPASEMDQSAFFYNSLLLTPCVCSKCFLRCLTRL
ncbi:hypothetical protein F383_38380 [Gossypium arboreum]|uniref:Uncharacterized protein n=1 Tax=Gossypium arboreum TaxID=29729 RepID=A0A0B0MBA8_GOSAR|nr:hypothetical protein F383_38380 [Gossypium arboreum]